ncbi:MAG: hypothetical protein ACE5QW_08935 [Thermoplasmata archaeon]
MTEESNLTVAGVVPAQTMIHLYEGWNLISFPSFNSSHTISDLKMSIGAVRVEGHDSVPPYYLRVLGDSEVLQAGYGYWVRVEADTVSTVSIQLYPSSQVRYCARNSDTSPHSKMDSRTSQYY